MKPKLFARIVLIFVLALTLVMGLIAFVRNMPVAKASTAAAFPVNTLDDHDDGVCNGGDCTLREAITAANANAGADTINFSVTGTINLASALPDIADDVTFNGPGASRLTV